LQRARGAGIGGRPAQGFERICAGRCFICFIRFAVSSVSGRVPVSRRAPVKHAVIG
jgi:hypothetical protein